MNVLPVARGSSSGIADATEVVVRSTAAWDTLWKSHAAAGAVPPIDFEREMVAAVFLGTKPTGGFSVEILRAHREAEVLVVEYVERHPSQDAVVAQVLTTPFHMVRLVRHTGPVRFQRLVTNGVPK